MSWGGADRPKVTTKLGRPINREGANGDIQIKGSALGAKLFAKWSGRWWDIPLSIDGVTRFGVTDSDYLSIDRDSVDIYRDSKKIASFGETTTIGDFSATSAGVVTVADINLSGKIKVTSTGSQNVCIGDWASGNPDVSGANFNVIIGFDAGDSIVSGSIYNTLIGHSAGIEITTGDNNVCIGTQSGKDITTSLNNVCVGWRAGSTLTDSASSATLGWNVYLGNLINASSSDVTNEVVIAGNPSGSSTTVGKGSNTMLLGYVETTDVYMNKNSTADVHCSSLILKEQADDKADIAGFSQIWVKNTGDGILMFTDDDGTQYTVDVTAV